MNTENQDNNVINVYNMLLYFAGTMLLYEPSEECVADFWTNDILKKLPVTSSNPNFIKAANQLKDSCVDKALCGKNLREDYIRLFSGPELPLAPPFESYYRNEGKMNPIFRYSSSSDFYKLYGWESKFKANVKDDHLAIEILFLTRMIEKYMALDDIPCRGEMGKEIRRFIDNHILSWVPEWNKSVQLNSNTLSFKGLGTLILACTEDIFSLLDPSASLGNSIKFLKN
jgi:putative dimethyl sulfoxide reductase chaperone